MWLQELYSAWLSANSIVAILSVYLNPWSLSFLQPAFLNYSKCGPVHAGLSSQTLTQTRVREAPFSDSDIMIPDKEGCWQH